jgi:hypothetical protein
VELTRDLSARSTEKDPSGLHDTCVHYSFVKERARDLREFGFFGRTVKIRIRVLPVNANSSACLGARIVGFRRLWDRAVVRQDCGYVPCRPQEGTIAEVSSAVNPSWAQFPPRDLSGHGFGDNPANRSDYASYPKTTSLANFRPTLMMTSSVPEPFPSFTSRATSVTRSPLI